MTLKQAAQSAIDVQDACNISGVARSMVEAIDAVRESGASPRQNPIVYLYLYKLMALQGHEPLADWKEYTAAETECKLLTTP